MSASFILDTSFIASLGVFNQFCETLQFRPALTAKQMPVYGLQHLAEQGGTLVLPNEVLKEITHLPFNPFDPALPRSTHMVHGLGLDDAGKPYLDTTDFQLSETRDSAPFIDYLVQMHHEGRVRCFASAQDYKHAAATQDLSGKIAIVADFPLKRGNGITAHTNLTNRRDKIEWGDKEILQVRKP